MASIKKIEGKTGTSYKITVTKGRDSRGKQIRHFKTWTPDRPMTARQMEKEVQRVAFEFEREIDMGFQADNRQSFEQYAAYVIDLKEKSGAAKNSIHTYHYAMEKIPASIKNMKLSEIRPQHLTAFYQMMAKPGTKKRELARAKIDFDKYFANKGKNSYIFSKESGIHYQTIRKACTGKIVKRQTAEIIAKEMGEKPSSLFEFIHDSGDISGRTIKRIHLFISAVLSQAEKEMLIQYNPAKRATLPAFLEHDPEYFQPEQIADILAALEEEPIEYRAMVHLFIVTGCRRGEILALKWDKVDFENCQIKIDSCLSYLPEHGIYEGPTKTKKERYIFLPPETVALLKKYRRWQIERRLKMGDQWEDSGYVFTKRNGGAPSPTVISNWLNRFTARHGLPHIHPHSFRHSAASIMIANGVDIVTVSKMLGHSSTSTTTDVYSHVIDDARHRATECIAEVILRKEKA